MHVRELIPHLRLIPNLIPSKVILGTSRKTQILKYSHSCEEDLGHVDFPNNFTAAKHLRNKRGNIVCWETGYHIWINLRGIDGYKIWQDLKRLKLRRGIGNYLDNNEQKKLLPVRININIMTRSMESRLGPHWALIGPCLS